MTNPPPAPHDARPKRLPRALALAALLATLAASTGCPPRTTDNSATRIDTRFISERHDRIEDRSLLLIDARRADAFALGHIPGARNLALTDIGERKDPELTRYSTIVVYGQNPGDPLAMAVAKRLIALGYSDVLLYELGFDAWRAAGLRVEGVPKAPQR